MFDSNKLNIFIPKIGESWIVDRLREEWLISNKEAAASNMFSSNLIWIMAPWMWSKIPKFILKSKKVICTIHHFEETDLSEDGLNQFLKRDQYIDFYHVISKDAENTLSNLTDKKIFYLPFWVNDHLWRELDNKDLLRKKYGFDKEDYIVGSFQRDTEGADLKSPKLIKGPDRFIEIVKYFDEIKESLVVLLTGKRRQYVIENLENLNIKYRYFPMEELETINELYNVLDLYIVSSRIEGGPQAILECAISKTPIISTDVGIAGEILDNTSIFSMDDFQVAEPNIEIAYNNALKFKFSVQQNLFNKMFLEII